MPGVSSPPRSACIAHIFISIRLVIVTPHRPSQVATWHLADSQPGRRGRPLTMLLPYRGALREGKAQGRARDTDIALLAMPGLAMAVPKSDLRWIL